MQCPIRHIRGSILLEVRAAPWWSDNTGTQLLHRKPSLEISKYESVGSLLGTRGTKRRQKNTNTEERSRKFLHGRGSGSCWSTSTQPTDRYYPIRTCRLKSHRSYRGWHWHWRHQQTPHSYRKMESRGSFSEQCSHICLRWNEVLIPFYWYVSTYIPHKRTVLAPCIPSEKSASDIYS